MLPLIGLAALGAAVASDKQRPEHWHIWYTANWDQGVGGVVTMGPVTMEDMRERLLVMSREGMEDEEAELLGSKYRSDFIVEAVIRGGSLVYSPTHDARFHDAFDINRTSPLGEELADSRVHIGYTNENIAMTYSVDVGLFLSELEVLLMSPKEVVDRLLIGARDIAETEVPQFEASWDPDFVVVGGTFVSDPLLYKSEPKRDSWGVGRSKGREEWHIVTL